MNKPKKDENWLQLEQDVHRFHVLLNPGKEVIHDHSVPDKDGGYPRQVDVVIKDPLTLSLNEALECRCYKRPQGVPWVEHAQGRIRSLQADKLALVSSSGWYKPAQIKADALNAEGVPIELRVCEDVTGPEAERFHPEPIFLKFLVISKMSCKFHARPKRAQMPEGFCGERFHFIHRASQKELSVQDVIEYMLVQKGILETLLPNEPTEYNIRVQDQAAEGLLAQMPSENWELEAIEFNGVLVYRVVEVPRPFRIRFYRQNAADTPMAAIVRYEFTLNNNNFFFELVYTPGGAGQIRMSTVDRRCDFDFRTVEWSVLAAGREPKRRRSNLNVPPQHSPSSRNSGAV